MADDNHSERPNWATEHPKWAAAARAVGIPLKENSKPAVATPDYYFVDKTDELYEKGIALEFYHIPSDMAVLFKAFITNLADNFTQAWNMEKTLGRSDSFHNYENTDRTISLSWDIVAVSVEEARLNFIKMSRLAMMSYPKYDQGIDQALAGVQNAAAIVEAPFFRVKLMNLISSAGTTTGGAGVGRAKISGLPCRLGGFTFTHNIETGYFADAIEGTTTDLATNPVKIYPKSIQASCEIFVIHDHNLGWSSEGEFRGGDSYPYDEIVFNSSNEFESGWQGVPYQTEQQPEQDGEINSLEQELSDARSLELLGVV